MIVAAAPPVAYVACVVYKVVAGVVAGAVVVRRVVAADYPLDRGKGSRQPQR
jgi:hypothetical protein